MTSVNGGTSIHVRGYPGGRWHNKPSVSKPKSPTPTPPTSTTSTRSSSAAHVGTSATSVFNSGYSGFGHTKPIITFQQSGASFQPKTMFPKPTLSKIRLSSSSSEESYRASHSPEVHIKFPPKQSPLSDNISISSDRRTSAYVSNTGSIKSSYHPDPDHTFHDLQKTRSPTVGTRHVYDSADTGSFDRASKYSLRSTNTSSRGRSSNYDLQSETLTSTTDIEGIDHSNPNNSTRRMPTKEHPRILNYPARTSSPDQSHSIVTMQRSQPEPYRGKSTASRVEKSGNRRGPENMACCVIL